MRDANGHFRNEQKHGALGQPPEGPEGPSKVLNNLARLIARYTAREHLSFTSPAPNDPVPPIPLEEGHSDVK